MRIDNKLFGKNQKFSGTDSKLLGKDKATQFRTVQISEQKQLRFYVKTFFVFIREKPIVSASFSTTKLGGPKKFSH